MKRFNDKGFTLVELLVVVAIIGILASIVLVSLNSARERAQKASLQSTLASITTLANLCINDGGSVSAPTSATAGDGNICDDSTITAETWPNLSAIEGLSDYQYNTTSDATISASDGTSDIVVCTVSTGSCALQ